MQKPSLYNPLEEHDACGVGFVANLDNIASHNIIQHTLTAMGHLTHRGGSEEDEKMSDGSGILMPISLNFFGKIFPEITDKNKAWGLGFFFLPYDAFMQESLMDLVKKIAKQHGFYVSACRDVPTDINILSRKVLASLPEFRQILFISEKDENLDIEKDLYVLRRQIEFAAIKFLEKNNKELSAFHICSLSSKSIVYKGILPGKNLGNFYTDLTDEDFSVTFAIFHERFSTNTKPSWHLTQPFRYIAHNGEINTIRCNKTQMNVREAALESPKIGEDLNLLLPCIHKSNSDSGSFDNVFELLTIGGYSTEQAILTMIPEPVFDLSANDKRNSFYLYNMPLMEAWDGPTTMVYTDGKSKLGATLDRNGLRPCRYSIINDNTVILGSESGVLDVSQDDYVEHGQLAPRTLFLVDLEQGKIISDAEIKEEIFNQFDYEKLLKQTKITLSNTSEAIKSEQKNYNELYVDLFGFHEKNHENTIISMVNAEEEPVGAMGLDKPLAVLNEKPQSLFNYFKQLFAQVTNPSIDPIREKMSMSLITTLGGKANLFQDPRNSASFIYLESPLLFAQNFKEISENNQFSMAKISTIIPKISDHNDFCIKIASILVDVEEAIDQGKKLIILSDQEINHDSISLPILLIVAAVHQELIRKNKRHLCDIIAETGQAFEVMHFALLLSFGANAIYPFAAYNAIEYYLKQNKIKQDYEFSVATERYFNALKKGLLKVLGRLGISAISSFAGAQCFEALGIHNDVIDKYFTSTHSRIGGICLENIFEESKALFNSYLNSKNSKPENNVWTKNLSSLLRSAVVENDYAKYSEYTDLLEKNALYVTLRSLWNFKNSSQINTEEVEDLTSIRKRFVSAPMSLGALSQESHECIAEGFNKLNLLSNCGEGGEDIERSRSKGTERDICSRVRQIASGRFGVTAEYLVSGDEVQIKIAQGAKPGEGGQLPAHKVSPYIAKARHTPVNIPLISPPPHHDIYSIEDLAQLIYDIKKLRKGLRVSVKLVAEAGIGTVAVGVVKAGADTICISGHDGGTGAAPLSSIYHVGLPWEIGVAEVHQALLANAMRYKVTLQADGQIFTGKDVVTAFMLGADEVVFGTALLVSMGCVYCRQCFKDRCPVGICTQDEKLRSKFNGKASDIENFINFIAKETQEYMTQLGISNIDELVGRADLLEMNEDLLSEKSKKLDMSLILQNLPYSKKMNRQPKEAKMALWEEKILNSVSKNIAHNVPSKFYHGVKNTDRAIATHIAGHMAHMAMTQKEFQEDFVSLYCTGTAGQSFGAFAPQGLSLYLLGSANDYVGKGLCGGKISISPYSSWATKLQKQSIIGNVALYGATSGKAFICGKAGERFAVRNSGAIAVVEGVGEHGCEYMTNGTIVILGECGQNFAAGMTGGCVFVHDINKNLANVYNPTSVKICNLDYQDALMVKKLLEEHVHYTQSVHAKEVLDLFEEKMKEFVKIIPK